MCVEGLAATQVPDFTKEREPARRVGVGERRQEEPPEQARKRLLSHGIKASLVYWKVTEALPAHEAFSKHGRRDARKT